MTYQQLLDQLKTLNEYQLGCTITVEGGPYGIAEDECIPAELRICGENHQILDDGHPVIYIAN